MCLATKVCKVMFPFVQISEGSVYIQIIVEQPDPISLPFVCRARDCFSRDPLSRNRCGYAAYSLQAIQDVNEDLIQDVERESGASDRIGDSFS